MPGRPKALVIGGPEVCSTWLLELPHGVAARFQEAAFQACKNVSC